MTAVEWLFTKLWNTDKDKFTWHSILEKAQEMERVQMQKSFQDGQWDVAKHTYDQQVK